MKPHIYPLLWNFDYQKVIGSVLSEDDGRIKVLIHDEDAKALLMDGAIKLSLGYSCTRDKEKIQMLHVEAFSLITGDTPNAFRLDTGDNKRIT